MWTTKRRALGALLILTGCREIPLQPQVRVSAPVTTAQTAVPAVCDVVWATAVDGEWTDTSRWSPVGVPGSSDVVCFNAAGTYEVTPPASVAPVWGTTVDQIRVLTGASVTFRSPNSWWTLNTRDLVVALGATATVADQAGVTATGIATIDGVFTTANNPSYVTALETGVLLVSGVLELETAWIEINTAGPIGLLSHGEIRLTGWSYVVVNNSTLVSMGGVGITGTGSLDLYLTGGALDWFGGTLPSRPAPGTSASVRVLAWMEFLWAGAPEDLSVTLAPQLTGALDLVGYPVSQLLALRTNVGVGMDLRLESQDPALPLTVDWLPPASSPSGSPVTNAGTLTTNAMTIGSTSAFLNTGLWTMAGVTGRVQVPMLRNHGTIMVIDSTRFEQGTLTNLGTIKVFGSGSSLVFANSGLVVDPAGAVTGMVGLESGGRLSGTGTLDRVRTVGGVVSPGSASTPLGSLTFASLTLDATSRMVTDIGSTTSMDRVYATTRLDLAGTLDVRTIAPFVGGVCGQVVQPITVTKTGTLAGGFTQYVGTSLTATSRWRPHTSTSSLQLVGHDPSRVLGLSTAAVAVAEGGASATTHLCFSGIGPTTSITVNATPRLAQSTTTPEPLVVTPTNWALPQTLTVRAVDDAIAEPTLVDSIRFRLTSTDAFYNGVQPKQLAVTVTDNDQGADLTTSLVSAPATVNGNQQFEARYRITNNGTAASTGSTFTVTPLAGVTFVTSTPQVTCTAGVGVLTCTAGALASGALVEFTLVYRATTAGTYVNTVRVLGNEYDPVVTNNSFTWNLTVN